jgi:hypothetical protein
MPYSIHASKDGERAETQRIHPAAAAAKAQSLAASGWHVYITDQAGRHFGPDELDVLAHAAEDHLSQWP